MKDQQSFAAGTVRALRSATSATILSLSMLLLPSSSAQAGTLVDSTYAGIECRWAGNIGDDHTLIPLNSTEIKNNTSISQAIDVVCPAVNSNASVYALGIINTSLGSAWTATSCTFYGNTFDGSTYFAFGTGTFTQVGQSRQFKTVARNDSMNAYASFAWACRIPPGEAIYKYDLQSIQP